MDTSESGIIRDIVAKEDRELFDMRINGYGLYDLIKQGLRTKYISSLGVQTMDLVSPIKFRKVIISLLQSIIQLGKILISRRHYSNVFFAFPRVENIGGIYVDKFSDPFISVSEINDYIILENGRGGIHMKPRDHSDHLINTDIITILSKSCSKTFKYPWYWWNKKELDRFLINLHKVYGSKFVVKSQILETALDAICQCKLIEFLLRRFESKNVFAVARPFICFAAAKHVGAQRLEMQHGITYSDTTLYSGYTQIEASPDYFLAFGDLKPNDVYGIEPKRIINVGWPLMAYFKEKKNIVKYGSEDFLVISEPDVSDKIINATLLLAESYPNSHFYIRPHPHELYTSSQIEKIHSLPNVGINNNKINIAEVMAGFENVIGENSTVMYEALSANKKVGKLYLSGLNPIYLEETDKAHFWEIHSVDDLSTMLLGAEEDKSHKSIYSDFNVELFKSLLK